MRRPSPPSSRAWRRSTPARSSGPRCGARATGPGPATWCCSPRPARRMISSVTSRIGASSSRRWSGGWHERVRGCRSARGAPEVGAAPARAALRSAAPGRRADPAHVRRGDGVQRERGVRRRAPRRRDLVLQAAGDRGFDRADRAPGDDEARLSPVGGTGTPVPVRVAGAARPDASARARALGGRSAPLRYLLAVVVAAAPVAAVLIWKSPYRIQRVLTFLDPWKDPRGHGYQTVESLLGFGAGGSLGVGLGESHQKLFFLPAAHTDFILSIVGEELGFAGVAGVLALFALIAWRGIKAAHAAPDAFGCWLALGLTLLLSVEALVNAGMALALLPTKGMALPFLSYGMSSVIASCFAAGVVPSVSGGAGGFLRRSAGAQR